MKVKNVTLPDLPKIHNNLTRRKFLAGAGSLLLLGAAGCGSGSGSSEGGGSPDDSASSEDTRMIKHKYGTTEIGGTPERVVTVGLTEQDYVIALGITPVGVREWFGEFPGALWPWARAEIGDDPLPEVLPVDELNFEQIAALEPDVILGMNSGLTQNEYDTLAQIAQTVAQPAEYADFGAPWQEITRIAGRALNLTEEAENLIPEIEDRFEQARADNPEFDGSTGLLAARVNDGSYYVYAEGPAPGFLTALGLELPADTAELFTDENRAPVQLSTERFDLLNSDVLLMGIYGIERSEIENEQIYTELDAVREGRDIILPELSEANGALSFGSVLSLPIALDEMVPRIKAATDGNPDTEVEEVTADTQ